DVRGTACRLVSVVSWVCSGAEPSRRSVAAPSAVASWAVANGDPANRTAAQTKHLKVMTVMAEEHCCHVPACERLTGNGSFRALTLLRVTGRGRDPRRFGLFLRHTGQVIRATTILAIRHQDRTVMAGDGQVTFGNTVLKQNAKKIRRLYNDSILAGF